MPKELIKKIKEFKQKKILVIGDLILDKYTIGISERLSPEAPVPIINVTEEIYSLGGAGNTALNIKTLGSNPYLIGILGNDNEARIFEEKLKENKISYNIVFSKNSKTIKKERVIAKRAFSQKQQIVRKDYNDHISLDLKSEKQILNNFIKNLEADIIVVSDYGKGTLSYKLLQENIIPLCKENKKIIIIDPRPKNKLFYKNSSFITPNFSEACEISNLYLPFEVKNAGKIAKKIYEDLNANVVLTMSEKGIYFYSEKFQKYFSTFEREVSDVSGAGDTVVAALAVGLANNLNYDKAILFANHAGGVKVEKFGVQPVSLEEIINDIKLHNNL